MLSQNRGLSNIIFLIDCLKKIISITKVYKTNLSIYFASLDNIFKEKSNFLIVVIYNTNGGFEIKFKYQRR